MFSIVIWHFFWRIWAKWKTFWYWFKPLLKRLKKSFVKVQMHCLNHPSERIYILKIYCLMWLYRSNYCLCVTKVIYATQFRMSNDSYFIFIWWSASCKADLIFKPLVLVWPNLIGQLSGKYMRILCCLLFPCGEWVLDGLKISRNSDPKIMESFGRYVIGENSLTQTLK